MQRAPAPDRRSVAARGGSADNINQAYSVNLSTELRNGTWKLRVNDNASADVGYINSWSITF